MAKREETTEKKMVSYEEVEKERKRINKERLNTFLRVVGLVTTVMLIVVGLFDVLFELSYFGRISEIFGGPVEHTAAWDYLSNGAIAGGFEIFDDGMAIGVWFPKLVLTMVLVAGVVGVIYLITFSIVDFVDFIKNIIKTGRQVTSDNVENIRSIFPKFGGKKEENKDQGIFETPKKKTNKKPAKENNKNSDVNEYGYSEAQLDALLRGEEIDIKRENVTEE